MRDANHPNIARNRKNATGIAFKPNPILARTERELIATPVIPKTKPTMSKKKASAKKRPPTFMTCPSPWKKVLVSQIRKTQIGKQMILIVPIRFARRLSRSLGY
jgi:hypothetical protein